jgi:hypothetical protein
MMVMTSTGKKAAQASRCAALNFANGSTFTVFIVSSRGVSVEGYAANRCGNRKKARFAPRPLD